MKIGENVANDETDKHNFQNIQITHTTPRRKKAH